MGEILAEHRDKVASDIRQECRTLYVTRERLWIVIAVTVGAVVIATIALIKNLIDIGKYFSGK